ncbi:hypothetical protein GETHLI_33960 [Geothrix limicola]|uniref:PKD domain-containing protein n=1 Tax=Geothrix limicola TaxID=2927978 RepID=A0ABQ5QM80_9BACT|nr:RHS repeat-associated core domain-containing protein [Geothrix limicola]GLH74894.1 hypothetical protein GETHLI_33960 [Geothrix limicola]
MTMHSMIKALRNLVCVVSLITGSLWARPINSPPAGASIGYPWTNQTYWTGQTINFTGNTDMGTSFTWTFGDGVSSSLQNPAHAYSSPGTYLVTFKASGTGYSTSTAQITLYIVAPPTIGTFTATPNSIRNGTSTTLAWSTTNATSLSISQGVGSVTGATSKVVSPTTTAQYVLTASNAGGSVTGSVTVNVYTVSVSVSPTSASLLLGETRTFSANVTPANQGVTWSASGGSINSGGSYTATSSGNFTVSAQSIEDPTKTAAASITVASVSVATPTPVNASVNAGNALQFTSTASGAVNSGVYWSVSGGGSISGSGLFTAATAGTYTVTATSVADASKSASTSVTVNSVVTGVSINPTTVALRAGEGTTFTASANGLGGNNTSVTWSATGGSVSNGAYTAPIAAGTYYVTATSVQDSSKSTRATVTVSPIVVATPTPTNGSVNAGNTLQFSAVVTGAVNTGVTWSTNAGCTINGSGLFSANSGGTFTVTATSVADPSKSASTQVTVNSVVTGVNLSPTTVNALAGGSYTFTASATGIGGVNPAVTWSTTGGSISNGTYTAPIAAGTYNVTATSAQDASKSATASVTVATIAVGTPTPVNGSVNAGSSLQYTSSVSGAANGAVTWSVSGGQTINGSGLFSATTAGTYTVTATSAADPTKSASTQVTVNSVVTGVNLSKTTLNLKAGESTPLTATAVGLGGVNPSVTWSTTGGTYSNGIYTAPVVDGNYTVTATSQQDQSKSASATVVVSPITVATPTAPSGPVYAGNNLLFSTSVTGAANTSVTWSVSGGGTIDGNGLFTATTVGGPYTVTAASVANPLVSSSTQVTVLSLSGNLAGATTVVSGGSATLTPSFSAGNAVLNPGNRPVTSGVGVTVGPLSSTTTYTLTVTNGGYTEPTKSATVTVVSVSTPGPQGSTVNNGGQLQFSATANGAGNSAVTWYVSGGGTIDGNGLFTATTIGGPYTVTATSAAFPQAQASTQVTVVGLSVSLAGATTVPSGHMATLTPSFAAGTGVLNPGNIIVRNGVGVVVGPVTTTTDYTLTVTNGAYQESASARVTVKAWVLKWKKDILYVGAKEVAEVDTQGTHVTMVDHLGSPRYLVGPTGALEGEQKYLPFGESLMSPADASKFAKGFTNHEQTDPSGLIYMQARFYAPWYGRFLSPDPARDQHFEETQSWNIYSYVQNNPTMNFDPNGMEIKYATVINGNSVALAKNDPLVQRTAGAAINYLNKSDVYAKAIQTVESSKQVTWVFIEEGSTRGDQGGKSIAWDPTNGTMLQNDRGQDTGQIQSPAVTLGHELGHRAEELEHPKEYDKNAQTDLPNAYQRAEEKRNITQVETPGNKQLGEPTRTNHLGRDVKVKGPTSRTPVRGKEQVDATSKKKLEDKGR